MAEYQTTQCHSVLCVNGVAWVEIRRQLVEMYTVHVRSRKQVYIWCSAFDNGRTDVDDK